MYLWCVILNFQDLALRAATILSVKNHCFMIYILAPTRFVLVWQWLASATTVQTKHGVFPFRRPHKIWIGIWVYDITIAIFGSTYHTFEFMPLNVRLDLLFHKWLGIWSHWVLYSISLLTALTPIYIWNRFMKRLWILAGCSIKIITPTSSASSTNLLIVALSNMNQVNEV